MSKPTTDRMLIAETDERGRVACVWIKPDLAAPPHPVRDPAKVARQIASFEITGADRTEVLAWLTARAESPA